MATRDNYQVIGPTLPELVLNLNLLLQRLADRMDKIEGIRGTPELFASLDMNGNPIIDLLQSSDTTDAVNQSELADQSLNTTDSPTFQSVTISVNLTVSGTLAVNGVTTLGTLNATGIDQSEDDSGYYKYTDSNGTVIHSFATT